jgi:hypothetical protein
MCWWEACFDEELTKKTHMQKEDVNMQNPHKIIRQDKEN